MTELPQQHVCKEEEVLTDQQLCNQERNSSVDQEDPQPPQIKEEHEDLRISQEGEQLVLKQETDAFMLTPAHEESDHSEPEPDSDHQLFPHNSPVAEIRGQKGNRHTDPGSTRNAEPEPKKRLHKNTSHFSNVYDSATTKSHVNTHTEVPQQHVCKEEEVLTDQQLCNQERNSSVDQEDLEPPQIKEEHEDLCISQEGEQLVLKQETDAFMLTPAHEERDHSEPEPNSDYQLPELPQQHVCKEEEVLADQQLCNQERNCSVDQEDPQPPQIKEEHEELCISQEGEQLVPKQEANSFMLTPSCEESDHSEPEPNSDYQILYHKSPVAEIQDQTGSKHVDSESIRNAEPEPKKRHHKDTSHNNNVYNSATTETHCNTHTGKKSLKCDICGKAIQFKSKLIIHLRSHTGEKPYLCKSCGKSFSQKAHLNEHLKIHRDEKPYPCTTCGKGHRTSKALLVHTRIHTGEKPYVCKLCGKSFSQKSHLNEHLKTHRDEKPYSCKTCGKGLRSRKALVIHMRIHTGEKPYPCNTCGKRFSHKSSLNGHLKLHTDEAPYSCKT
ncbi:zinc finger protein 37-like [Trachinotus anak]|uniref:zinc finger protein 37-like n=1 Tax=Trachinotus anak TaxID=443729 RepID=UPI0039F21837